MERRYSIDEMGAIHKFCSRWNEEDKSALNKGWILLCTSKNDCHVYRETFGEKDVYTCVLSESAFWILPEKQCVDELYHKIIETCLLLKDLEDNRLIYYLPNKKETTISKVAFSYAGKCLQEYSNIPPITAEMLTKEAYCICMATQTLVEMDKNGFRTESDLALEEAKNQSFKASQALKEAQKQTRNSDESLRKAQKQTKYALIALLVAIASPFISFLLGRCTNQHVWVDNCPTANPTTQKERFQDENTDSLNEQIRNKDIK